MNHTCEEGKTCTCNIVGLEPSEECPIHGRGVWPPVCDSCGKFMRWPKSNWEEK